MPMKLSIVISITVWALAMARMLPRAWRLDRGIQRRRRQHPEPASSDRRLQTFTAPKAGTG